jgi:hypothetical protein
VGQIRFHFLAVFQGDAHFAAGDEADDPVGV